MNMDDLKNVAEKASEAIEKVEDLKVVDKIGDALEKVEGSEKAKDMEEKLDDAVDKAKSVVDNILHKK